MLEEEEELDDETIQAKVDASLAKIHEITSVWLKPKKAPSAPKRDFEKEIEEIMRRPPRLGVGAELPEKQVKSGPSELKLKNKMLGKKREREETNGKDSAVDPTPEDDEEESKSRVIQKKPRLDPFASGKKKGKGLSAPATVPPHKPAGTPPDFESKPEVAVISTNDEGAPGASSSKNTLDMVSASKPTLDADESDDEGGGKESVTKSMAVIPKPTPDLPPILNLHCPPAMRDDPEPSPKKKRRKKKKKHHVGGDAGVTSQTPTG